MKRLTVFALVALFAIPALAQDKAQQPTLGDIARANHHSTAGKTQTKVYDNDNLPTTSTINITGQTAAPDAKDAKAGDSKDAAAADANKDAAASAEDKAKLADDFKKQVADQEKEVATLTRELDILQREDKLRAATFYADAGNRLRDEKKYAEDDRKYQQDITDKQTALATAKQKLDDIKETARKAGLGSLGQ